MIKHSQWIQEQLQQLGYGAFHYYETIESTNQTALEMIETGAPDGTVLFADHQSAGRGRMQRRWITRKCAGLAFTLILRDLKWISPQNLGLISLLGAESVRAALCQAYNLQPLIKWPNDVLLNEKKVCGILSEAVWHEQTLTGIALGIGINIKPEAVPPANELLYPATSVEEHLGRPIQRELLLIEVLKQFKTWQRAWSPDRFLAHYQNHLAFVGEWVNIINKGQSQPVVGKLTGTDEHGNIVLMTPRGETAVFSTGDVSVRGSRGTGHDVGRKQNVR
ncbi:MAG: biotin--[acetyl-CoA-carboxylase] ligase [Anaerolineaceae bacterium]|nr:biotin--[acetyl-CoA-carboxylase] ligase [Anaerolineaceae bacterium]